MQYWYCATIKMLLVFFSSIRVSFKEGSIMPIRLNIALLILMSGLIPSISIGMPNQDANAPPHSLVNALPTAYPAPEIEGIEQWINSPPLNIKSLHGQVVLINFWTFACYNCQNTLPYFNQWYDKYHDKGLVIIGIHSPEFEYESNLSNVQNAVIKDGIKYPVALDNHFTTWRNYQNKYWPARYLIDKKGNVVYSHFGEGDYEKTENNIRYSLGIN
jgi:thiol-disulfide isomerase/thioredoxin